MAQLLGTHLHTRTPLVPRVRLVQLALQVPSASLVRLVLLDQQGQSVQQAQQAQQVRQVRLAQLARAVQLVRVVLRLLMRKLARLTLSYSQTVMTW
jgi:hypothetical protein